MIWTDEHVQFAKERFDASESYPTIAGAMTDHFGEPISCKAVRTSLARRYPQELQQRVDLDKLRAEARNEDIRRMYAGGFSPRAIAEAHDVGLKVVYSVVDCQSSIDDRSGIAQRIIDMFGPPWARRSPLLPELEPPVVATGKRLVDLDHHECRWPIGRDTEGAYRFCGDRKITALRGIMQYCMSHTAEARRQVGGVELGSAKMGRANLPIANTLAKMFGDKHDMPSPLDEVAA